MHFLLLCFICVCVFREYSEMATVRHVDFADSHRPKSLKMADDPQTAHSPPVRSSPQLVNGVAH